MQVYQLPMEWRGRFADMLEALEAQSATLGVTHYAVTMPTLEEVFLCCTAESHAQDSMDDPNRAADSSDSHCTVTLTPQAKQPAAASAHSAVEMSGTVEQAGSSGTHAASTSGTAESASDAAEAREQGHHRGSHAADKNNEDMGSGAGSSSPASSNGDGSDGVSAVHEGGSGGLPLPISRDDSAEVLSSTHAATEEPHSDRESGKTPDRSGHGASTSRQRSQDTPLNEPQSTSAKDRSGAKSYPPQSEQST